MLSLWLTIGTGLVLAAVEAGARLLWFHQGRGVMTMAKLALLCAVPLAWDYRLPILLVVIVIGSVGSHMPGRYPTLLGGVPPGHQSRLRPRGPTGAGRGNNRQGSA